MVFAITVRLPDVTSAEAVAGDSNGEAKKEPLEIRGRSPWRGEAAAAAALGPLNRRRKVKGWD